MSLIDPGEASREQDLKEYFAKQARNQYFGGTKRILHQGVKIVMTNQDLYDLETAILHHRERFPSGVVEILEKLVCQRTRQGEQSE